jgi:hypothetical protein
VGRSRKIRKREKIKYKEKRLRRRKKKNEWGGQEKVEKGRK